MKQNVKCIVLSNRSKSTKSPSFRYRSIQQNLNKTRIPYFCLTIEIDINAHSLGNITSKFEVHTRNTDHFIAIQTRQVVKKHPVYGEWLYI